MSSGAGVDNSPASDAQDTQYRRFAPDGTTQIDATLLGWLEFTGSQAFQTLEARFSTIGVGPIIYFGWGDEGIPDNPIPDARILVVPEPTQTSAVLGSALVMLAVRRQRPLRCARG